MLHDDLHGGARAIVGTFIVSLIFLAGFLGCNSEQKSWEEAVASNTSPVYEAFLAKYPTGPLADSARSHLGVLAWQEAESLNTQAAYESFGERYPQDPRSLDAAMRTKYFEVLPVGTGKLSLPEGERDIRTGIIVSIRPQWDSLQLSLDDETVFAMGAGEDTLRLLYMIPIDLADTRTTSSPRHVTKSGVYDDQITWIPWTNTFSENYNAFGTGGGRVGFDVLYKATKKAIKVGFVFQGDLGKVKSVHVAETIIPVEAFTLKQAFVKGK